MTVPRILLVSLLGLVALGAGWTAWRSHREIAPLEQSSAALGVTARRVLKANQLMDGAVEALRQHLLDVQTRTSVPESYAAWGRQQETARAEIKRLRSALADLETLVATPELAGPALSGSLEPLRPLVSALEQRWFAYDEQGSGLTPHSRAYAVNTLLPLVATELRPAVRALRGLHQSEWSQRIAEAAARAAAAHGVRLAAATGALLALVGMVVAAVLPTPGPRRFRPNAPAIPIARIAAEIAQPLASPMPDFARMAAELPADVPKVLVVAATPALREMLSLLIGTGGYSVVTAANGAEVVAAVKVLRFELLVIDHQMPGIGSLEILQEARALLPRVKAILVTDTPGERTAQQLSSHRIASIISKRPDPRELISKISEALTGTPTPFAATLATVLDEEKKAPPAFSAPEPEPVAETPEPPPVPKAPEAPPPPPPPTEPASVAPPFASSEPPPEALSPGGEQPRRARLKRRPVVPEGEPPPSEQAGA